jgi:hypothetical protein
VYKILVVEFDRTDGFEDQDVDSRIILKQVVKKGDARM